MNPDAPDPTRNPRSLSTFFAAVLGGLVVLVAGAALIATGVIDTGQDKTVVRERAVTQPSANTPSAVANDGEGRTVQDIYKQEGEGVVFIQADGVSEGSSPFGEQQSGTATGSGFLVDKQGTILTNAHVVAGATDVSVKFEEDGDSIPAEVKGTDTSSDLAVIKIDPDKAKGKPLPLGKSSTAQVGDPVIAIGNPYGFTRTVTTGIVSALQRQIQAPNGFAIDDVIQTDASINPGNSGGPLLDSLGRVIGINSQIATAGGSNGNIGIGFAVPINTAKKIAGQLKKQGSVQHAFLGITGVSINSSLSQSLNLPADQGVLIQATSGPAKKAGVKGGDTQVSVGGQDLLLGGDVLTAID
ncbi:MAG TPA: trypsin-like peptidase domain-containing protein, partial [Thermoleophilaceae bacterium]